MECYYCAGIVTYHPDMELLEKNIASIAPQVLEVLIVDNGSKNIEAIRALCTAWDNVTLLENGKNLGVAAAMNRIMSWAQERGYEWALTLDQDNVCLPDMMEQLSSFACNAGIGALGAYNVDSAQEPCDPALDFCWEEMFMINNGRLTNVEAWKRVGGFDERLFVDHVDFEFILRLHIEGYSNLTIRDARTVHCVGEPTTATDKDGNRFQLFNQSPKRHFYFVRSNVYYLRKLRGSGMDELALFQKKALRNWTHGKLRYEKRKLLTCISTLAGIVAGFAIPCPPDGTPLSLRGKVAVGAAAREKS